MSHVDDMVGDLREHNELIGEEKAITNRNIWKSTQKMAFDPDPDPNQFSNCTQEGAISSEIIQKGPYISTSWGQKAGYNNHSPNIGCSNNQLPPAGCVATAMAQIMRFHQRPVSYNWTNMANSYSTSETSRLIGDAGSSVNMDYGCDESGAATSDVATALVNNFGYTSANFQDYNYNVVVSEINANRPVILSGGKNDGWWIFGNYSDGHAWVCDGLIQIQNYECRKTYTPFSPDPILMKHQTSSSLFLHMNWGWYGQHDG